MTVLYLYSDILYSFKGISQLVGISNQKILFKIFNLKILISNLLTLEKQLRVNK